MDTDTTTIGPELAAALVAALGDMPEITKDHTAKVPTKAGGSYSYTYAALPDILDAVRPVLARHGLGLIQSPVVSDDGRRIVVETMIVHTSGQTLVRRVAGSIDGGTMQALGSAITYLRRYALVSMLSLAPDDDDDANAACGHDGAETRRHRESSRQPRGNQSGGAPAPERRPGPTPQPGGQQEHPTGDDFTSTRGFRAAEKLRREGILADVEEAIDKPAHRWTDADVDALAPIVADVRARLGQAPPE